MAPLLSFYTSIFLMCLLLPLASGWKCLSAYEESVISFLLSCLFSHSGEKNNRYSVSVSCICSWSKKCLF